MSGARTFVIAVSLVLSQQVASSAQDLSRYRVYALDSTLESVIATSGSRAADVKTLHERPAKIQELEWRAPYVSSGDELADPVRDIDFTFYNDALYQIVVSYDRDRTDGLTNNDLVESLTAVYGVPVLRSVRTRPEASLVDTVVVAQWETPASSVTLTRGSYSPEFRLIVLSKALSARARSAIREALRLDLLEAPRREAQERQKQIADANTARDKARITNKAAFRP